MLHVHGARQTVDECGNVRRAANFVEIPRAAQFLFERDEVDGIAAFDELDHLVEDPAMRVAVEVARVDDLGGEVERVVVEQDRAENRTLRFQVMRERAFGYTFGHERDDYSTCPCRLPPPP